MESGDTMRDFILGIMFFFCVFMEIMICVVQETQTKQYEQVIKLAETVAEHQRIMKAYEFANWKMGFTEEKEEEK